MSTSYQVQGHTRRCAATGRELRPGEKVVSALLDQAGRFVRLDYAAEAWPGPPDGAVGFWSGRVPSADEARRKPAVDDELLLECFERLADDLDPARRNFRYVVGLLLMRRRRLKFEDVRRDAGREYLCLRCAKTGARYEVPDPRLTEAEMADVQDEVFRVLGWS
jgi:hypothetical protein